MGGPFDGLLGGLQQGAVQVGNALKNFASPQPSRPAQPSNTPLPEPNTTPTQAQPQRRAASDPWAGWKSAGSSFGGAATKTASNPGLNFGYTLGKNLLDSSFAKDMGISNLASNLTSTDAANKNTMAGQIADPQSPVSQTQQAWKKSDNPIPRGANYVANVLNAGVVDPIALAANPQMWFAEDHGKATSGVGAYFSPLDAVKNNVLGMDQGHNYLRDTLGPIVKKVTGEDVPSTPMTFESDSKSLLDEKKRLDDAQASLGPNASAEDVAAFDAAVTVYNAKSQAHFEAYEKSANWWANSNVSKTLSLLGQIATFPAGFAAGMATFVPQLLADPIGTGESLVTQVTMAANFAETLMDEGKRSNMSAQELAANISNVAMLGGMLFGPKGAGKATKGASELARKTGGDLRSVTAEMARPEEAPHAITPAVDPNAHPVDVQTHQSLRQEDLTALREAYNRTVDPNERGLILKQINDIQDEQRVISNTPKPKVPEPQEVVQARNTEQNLAQDAVQRPGESLTNTFDRGWDRVDDNRDVASDLLKEMQGEQRPEYTRPVYPQDGFADHEVDTMLKGLEDFSAPAAQAEALRKNPQDYASPSSKLPDEAPKKELTIDEHKALFDEYQKSGKMDQVRSSTKDWTEGNFAANRKREFNEGKRSEDFVDPNAKIPADIPTVKFEELNSKSIEAMAKAAGFKVTTIDKMTGNSWVMRNGKAISIGGAFDPAGNHDMFIREMKLPGDGRKPDANGEHNQVKMDLMRQGWIRVSDFAPLHLNLGVDRFDAENVPMMEEVIRNDMAKNDRLRPYMIDEWDTGKHYTIDPQELVANGDLGNLITQIRRMDREKAAPRTELPGGPTPPKLYKQAVEGMGLKVVPANKVNYGFLFPDNKGADFPDGVDRNHGDLWKSFNAIVGRELSPKEYQSLAADAVELRRGYGNTAHDYYFFAQKWTDTTLKVVQDYLQQRTSRPNTLTLESRFGSSKEGRGLAGDTKFGWSDFKENDFKLEGLLNRKSFEAADVYSTRNETDNAYAARTETPGAPEEQMGPWLWDKFRAMTKAENQVKFFEDRIAEFTAAGKETRKDEVAVQRALAEVQRHIGDLPEEIPPRLAELRDRLQEKLNEKGVTATTTTGAESATSEGGQGLNKTPPGAEGTTLASVIAGPQGKGQIAFWTPDAKSTGTVPGNQRQRVEQLADRLGREIRQLVDIKAEGEDIAKLEELPQNLARRESEVTETIKANVNGLDPLGVVSPDHIVFDRNLTSEALYEPQSGMIRFNVTRSIPIEWAQAAAGLIQRHIIDIKEYTSDAGFTELNKWLDNFKSMTQAQFDWASIAEEVLHKYDIDHLSPKSYLEALSKLPWQWWDHARRSGLGDEIEGGITTRNLKNEEFTLKAVNGEPVTSWYQAFALARQGEGPWGSLDEPSYVATLHAFMEFRVTQLRNFHGVPGTKFTYRVPEVMIREIENPDLIREGSTFAGNDFERYVTAETADGLTAYKSSQKEAQANVTRGNAANAPTTSLPDTPGTGIPGRDTGNQTYIKGQDHPQIGDRLQVNMGTKEKPNWQDFWNDPIKDVDDARQASLIVSTRGAGTIYSRPAYARDYRVVSKGDQVRQFKDPIPDAPQEEAPTAESSTADVRENPATFHGIPVPTITPMDLSGRPQPAATQGADRTGFSRKTLRLSESDPVNVPVPNAIGEGYTEPVADAQGKPIAQSLKYKPITALRDTGYPGSWVDFLKAMADPETSPSYRSARPYWDALEPKYKRAWMEALQEPGLEQTVLNAEPSPEVVSPEMMNSPEFAARQAKIQEYQAIVANSGKTLDKLSKTVNTAAGLAKYAQAKAKVAMAAKFVSIPPGVPFKEAYQLAGAEYTRVMDEITKQPTSTPTQPRDPQVEALNRNKSLTSQLTPQTRTSIANNVVRRTTDGNIAKGFYKSLDAFIDGYAFREPDAVKLYRTLPGLSKDAIKGLVEQFPQSFKLGAKDKLDQTSIPMSQQTAPEHINPVNPEQFKAIAQGAVKALVRHGSTDYNERGLIRGHSDPPLSSLGRLQARNLARAFAGRRGLKIATHDLSRAQETANSIATRAPGAKVTVDENLRPWDVGEELTGSSVITATPKINDWMKNQPDYAPPGGESFNQFKARFLPALKQHISDKDLIVVSTRNQRVAEGWIANGMPDDLSIDEASMLTPREIGPGGIMALGNKSDGNFTITNKVSQAPSDAEAMAAPSIPKSPVSLRPEQITMTLRRKPMGGADSGRGVQPVREPEGSSPQSKYNFKIGEQVEAKTAKIKGELPSAIPSDRMDRIDAIVADTSIDPTNPLKIAAVRAQAAWRGIQDARSLQVPQEAIDGQVKDFTTQIDRLSELTVAKAKADLAAAPLTAPRPPANKMLFDTSLTKAEEHRDRMLKGMDWAASTTRAAKEMILEKTINPLGDMIGMLKDGADGLLDGQKDHLYHSLSPAFKEVFVDPHAVEVVKQAKLSEHPKSGLLPLPTEKLLGVDVPVDAPPFGAQSVAKARAERKSKSTPKQKTVVPPAIADTLRSRTPNPDPPIPESIPEMQKRYKFELGAAEKMSTKELRQETDEIHKAINTPAPDLLADFEDVNLYDFPEHEHQVEDQVSEVVADGSSGGKSSNGGGGKGKPPKEPLKGWDDSRDMLSSLGGDHALLARFLDRGVKSQARTIDASSKYAHPVLMAIAHIYARTKATHTGDQMEKLLDKMIPGKQNKDGSFVNEEERAHHEAIGKAIGGEEVDRQKALRTLSPQDQAIANALHTYHAVMGRIGTEPETHVFDHAIEGYFRRQVLFDDEGKPVNGNSKFNKKMGIAFSRRQRENIVRDEDGKEVITKENYYKDTQALKDAGFRVQENIGKLIKNHWDQFSNMNITHQLIRDLSTLDTFNEIAPRKGETPWVGRVLVPRMEMSPSTKKMAATVIGGEYRNQLRTVTKGPFEAALRNYRVYYKVADIFERMATRNEDTSLGDKSANLFSHANSIYKVIKFGYNPMHAFNLWSNLYAYGTHGLLDPATYNPKLLHYRIFGRVDKLLSEGGSWKDWDGSEMHGTDVINRIIGWGGVLPKEIVDVASLGGLTGTLSRYAPAFKEYHKAMWHDLAWKAHIGLVMHQMEVAQKTFLEKEGHPMNEAEFENTGLLATEMSKYAMGFIDKTEMNHNWQVYANALYLANSWSLSQLRLLGMAGGNLPGFKYLANLGGGEKYNQIVSSKMMSNSGMTQHGLDTINGMRGQQARRMMLGGAAKLIATSTIIAYLGSYLGNSGQAQGPYENFQRDPTHTFDVYLGTDPATGKDLWQHNPLFGMQQEMLSYLLEGVKGAQQGKSMYEVLASIGARYMGKNNPILRGTVDLASGRNLALWVKGYGDRSIVDHDPQVIAIRRALDATGKNPFPDSVTNNLIYAIREMSPITPGFPGQLNVNDGTAPSQTNATLGNVLNALGPGKLLGVGDLINAIQGGPQSADWGALVKVDLGNLAQFALGTSQRTSSTPQEIAKSNQTGSAIATRDARDQALNDLSHAAQAGDWKTVAQISQQLNLSTSQMTNALLHPVAGGGQGVLYQGLPSRQSYNPPQQESLLGQELSIDDTSKLVSARNANVMATIQLVTAMPEFKAGDSTSRASAMTAYIKLVESMTNDQFAQSIGLLGGTPISDNDIQGALSYAIELRAMSADVLAKTDLYQQADPFERQRMETSYGSFSTTLARDAYLGNLKNVPMENIKEMLSYTIETTEATKSYLENSMFYQLAAPGDQQRMLKEYTALSQAMSKRQALQQGQGNYNLKIPPEKMVPTIQFIINTEETAKSALHGTDYYNSSDPTEQKALDGRYETFARGLAFSRSNADPRVLIRNSLNAEQSYFDLQSHFGGTQYIKTMAQELADIQRNVRTGTEASPRQIAAIERNVRLQFLRANPAYAAWLQAKTNWVKYSNNGQIWSALNQSEFAAVDDMRASGVISSDSLLVSGTSIDNAPMDPGVSMQLPSINYSTFNSQNP